ncbi:hypothetical protein D1BOALGB6SA_5972 [Olavius sp. associated proteobacterium Delta 1]|nr:hypothetical protein D1BOALGB6SA_5972 [Olavius sp. associated proteobacterium Delta 1]
MDPIIGIPLMFLGGKAIVSGLEKVRQSYIDNHAVQAVDVAPAAQNQVGTQVLQQQQHRPQPLTPGPIAPSQGYHGTGPIAGHDIFHNKRFVPGVESSFWIAETFQEAQHYAYKEEGTNGVIIEFLVDQNSNCLEKAETHHPYWIAKVIDADPYAYYSMPGLYPTALYRIDGVPISSKQPPIFRA